MTEDCNEVEPLHSAWLDGELEPPEHTRVEVHLRRCAACRRGVETLRVTRAALGNLPPRRLPAEVGEQPELVGDRVAASPADRRRPRRARVATVTVVVLGLVGGAAFALGGEPGPGDRVVEVPLDVFVADHLVRTVGGPVSTPPVVDGRR